MNIKFACLFFFVLIISRSNAQTAATWNGKQCAVVLTYDDALDIDLDNVVPALDSAGLKGTFYLIGSSPAIPKRIDAWRRAAASGHELGNHTSFHPCDGQLPGRSFVSPETDLSKYTLKRLVSEIRLTNTLLSSIDGKTERTFAFPWGDKKLGDDYYYDAVKQDFLAARGVRGALPVIDSVDLSDVNCYSINGQTAAYMIGLVKKAKESHALLVFLFHGVGGGHNLNVSLEEHSKLIHYLQQQEKEIWIAPMVEIARFVKNSRLR